MPQHRLFKLEKLKIKAYSGNRRLESELVGLFEAMFNPESFKQRYEILYGRGQGLSSSDQEATFSRNRPSDLNLRLLLDGTGVHELGIMKLGQQEKVSNRVERFLDLTFRMNGKIHQPNYLLVEWGELSFSCRLGSVDINYTSFNRDGTALRAELDITLISDTEVEKRLRQDNLTSPDLTHKRLIKAGDTLPLLTQAIYGSSAHYLMVARVNQLDDFRNLIPGETLFFPPLTEQPKKQKKGFR